LQAPTISYTHCGFNANKLKALEELYKCDIHAPNTIMHKMSQPFANGVLVAGERIEDLSVTQERLGIYGVLNPRFMAEFMEQLLWYNNVTVYAMTIIFILFLRKTVY
jgi:hypothetical protein